MTIAQDISIHPAANLIPEMDDDGFEGLKPDGGNASSLGLTMATECSTRGPIQIGDSIVELTGDHDKDEANILSAAIRFRPGVERGMQWRGRELTNIEMYALKRYWENSMEGMVEKFIESCNRLLEARNDVD